jgi:integrase
MAGKQAKTLDKSQLADVLSEASRSRYPTRDRAIVLLSARAGLRAGEIAKLTWPMLTTADGQLADCIELHDRAAKKRSGRTIPLHPALRTALAALHRTADLAGPVILSERGAAMTPSSVVTWFWRLYRRMGLIGCSSHSGRRTFITRAAQKIHLTGGSIRDVQQLAGHRSLTQTQAYIEGNTNAQRRLVRLL